MSYQPLPGRLAWLLHAAVLATSAVSWSADAGAQVAPRGRIAYLAEGTFQSAAMDPWDVTVTIRDTTYGGTPAVIVDRVSARTSMASFRDQGYFARETGELLAWQHDDNGRAAKVFSFEFTGARVRGFVEPEGERRVEVDEAAPTNAIPTPLLGHALGLRSLREGDTLLVTSLDYVHAVGVRFRSVALVAPVTVLPGGGSRWSEATWYIEGGAEFPARFWIARQDGVLLRAEIPQGAVGMLSETVKGR